MISRYSAEVRVHHVSCNHCSQFQDFVRVVAHFRPVKKNPLKNKLNTRMEKLHFAFRMYDLDGDDKISKVIYCTETKTARTAAFNKSFVTKT